LSQKNWVNSTSYTLTDIRKYAIIYSLMGINLNKIRTYSLSSRKSKVRVFEFARTLKRGLSFKKFYDSLPEILRASDFKDIVNAIISARRKKKSVIFMCGTHVINAD